MNQQILHIHGKYAPVSLATLNVSKELMLHGNHFVIS